MGSVFVSRSKGMDSIMNIPILPVGIFEQNDPHPYLLPNDMHRKLLWIKSVLEMTLKETHSKATWEFRSIQVIDQHDGGEDILS